LLKFCRELGVHFLSELLACVFLSSYSNDLAEGGGGVASIWLKENKAVHLSLII